MTSYFTHETKSAIAIHLLNTKTLAEFAAKQSAATKAWIKTQNFIAKPDSCLLVPDAKGNLASVLAGTEETLHIWSIAHVAAAIPDGTYKIQGTISPSVLTELATGFSLAQYQFTKYKALPTKKLKLALPKSVDTKAIGSRIEAITLTRDLINTPPNDMGPADLAAAAKNVAKETGATFKEIVGDALLKQNYPAIHAVGRAATQAPRLIELTHGKKSHPLVVLVGKGVTFDTGGLDLKPYASMKLMKKDMGGAALMLGLTKLIIKSGLPIRLRTLIPAVENSIGSDAFRPQDIIQSRKGLTIEIGSTDAEGRLILADALTDGDADNPALLIDAATLTGAARTALGPDLPALYSNRDDIALELMKLSMQVRDPVWHLPLWQPYSKHINNPIADITNTPNFGFAGSITAALFLERFVSPTTPWVHLDTYAWNADNQPGRPAGGEALALRTLFTYLQNKFG